MDIGGIYFLHVAYSKGFFASKLHQNLYRFFDKYFETGHIL